MIISVLLILLNIILYFLFGSLICRKVRTDGRLSLPVCLLAGFFLYYSLFTCFCVPIMYRWRPLSMLSAIWAVVIVVVSLLAVLLNIKKLRNIYLGLDSASILIAFVIITVVEAVIIVYAYQFTLDAAYYVANVGTSVETNMMNVYDPYTGDWQDHFQMRYFFATYPQLDAVMCYLFGIHPLLQTKIVMASVTVMMTNIVYLLIGKELFEKERDVILFLVFATIAHFFFITIYTSSNFLITRTYEGKSILANVILPAIMYFYIRIKKDDRMIWWGLLFLVCFGSTVVSNSSNMIVPAALFVFFAPLSVINRNWKIFAKSIICMVPSIVMLLVYVAYVKGLFVFYTYPR